MFFLVNDDSEESDRPKRKKSRSMWGDSDSEDSDNSWRQRKKKWEMCNALKEYWNVQRFDIFDIFGIFDIFLKLLQKSNDTGVQSSSST